MTADPRTFELRGTAMSLPYRDPFGSLLSYCPVIVTERELNTTRFHRCYPVSGASSYIVSNNLAFNGNPDDVSGLTRPAARFDRLGRPLPAAATPGTIAIDTLRAAGVDLTSEPVVVSTSLTRDIDHVDRISAPPGAGAWVLPVLVDP